MIRILLIFLLSQCFVVAAEISWSPPQNITGTIADFDTVGEPLYQWNAGNNTITIDPDGLDLTFSPGALFNGTVHGNVDPHNRGGNNEYEQLLAEMTHTSNSSSLNLTGLTPGHRYRLQLWMADTRSCCEGRSKTYDSGSGTQQVVLNSGPPSQFVIGSFIADSSTQEIRFIGSGSSHPQYNALAVRTLGPPTPDIEQFQASTGSLTSPVGVNVPPSTPVTLNWQISDADTVTLTSVAGNVNSVGNTTVSPSSTTTYTLAATNEHGTSQKTITVYVNAAETVPRINELVSNNDDGLNDEDGDASDWIELYNPNPFVIDAGKYRITDDPGLNSTWQIPSVTAIPANGYLLIFASGKNRSGAELHTDFRLDADGDYIAITDSTGATVLTQLPEDYPSTALFPEIPSGRSYGYDDSDQLRFFNTTTPNESNGDGFLGFVGDTTFSDDRGFYEASFNLTIATDTPNANIRYTTDGSPPSETNGTLYTGPLSITQTTVVRAMAYLDGYAPTNIDTHTYIFASDVIASGVMDTGITQSGTYGPQMINSLKALPIISLNIEDPDGVDNSSENRTSVELIFPDGSEGFQEDAGVSYFGGYFTNFDKKSFRLYFRKEYGVGKLDFPLYKGFANGIAPVEKFDALDLRSGSHDMAMRGAYMSNRFTDDTMLEMGNISPHGRFVHLFRNGVYWGQYHLRERWNAAMAEEYFGGEKEDYEAINGNANVGGWSPGVAYDGDGSGWQTIKDLANGSTPWNSLQSRLDLQSYIDFWLLYDFGSSENEYRAFGTPNENGVKMKFYLNDADGYLNPTGIAQNNDAGGPGNIFGRLESENHPDFKTYLADRIYTHYFHDGVFAAHKTIERLQNRVDEIQLSFYCEAARWGYRSPSSWQNYQNNLINNQFPSQTGSRLDDLRDAGRYPDVEAPEYNQNGGVVGPGFGVYVSSLSGGTIYYTTDGSDPRLSGGAINPSAVALAATGSSTTLLASGSTWKYRDNGSNQGTAWRSTSFNDNNWSSGNAKLGYGDGNENTTVSFGGNSSNKHITTYFRKTFNVADASAISGLTMEILRDDGAIVYINGQEVVRSNMPTGNVNYTTTASGAIGGQNENAFHQFTLAPSLLVTGVNTIAVEIHQAAPDSSDLGFDLRLTATTGASTPDLILTSDTQLNARVLKNGTWSALHPATFIVSQPPVTPQLGDLVCSEIHYHPSNPTAVELTAIPNIDDGDFEFLELMNISSQPLRLDGCVFVDGIDYIFPEDSILQPGERLVIASNAAAFGLRHSASLVHGEYTGGLRNSGERLAIENTSNALILDLTYGDGTDQGGSNDTLWPTKPDGSGESLVMIHPSAGGDLSDPLNWRASANNHGMPGGTDSIPLPVDLNQDLDLDGSSALLELTLNSSDSDPANMPAVVATRQEMTDNNSYLTLSLTRNPLMPAKVIVQTCLDLVGWNDNAVLVSRQFHADGTETLTYRFPVPENGEQQFMRVKAQH
ncbi:hypothetical protein NT6N_02400 [Oceaniferula spumae]|uniref:LTD domain-containing protein n=1 Tax=Oceaniferula spumae TaxID=2979115 RepID=A0AAT9FGU9_9BACT